MFLTIAVSYLTTDATDSVKYATDSVKHAIDSVTYYF